MKKIIPIRSILCIFLALLVCIGCCTPAMAVEETTADGPIIEETHDLQDTVSIQSIDTLDPPIDKIITPPIPMEWLIPALLIEFLPELLLFPFRWIGEKLSDAWYTIQEAFWDVIIFFDNWIHK